MSDNFLNVYIRFIPPGVTNSANEEKRIRRFFFNENMRNCSQINKTTIYRLAQSIIYHFGTAYNGCLHLQ